jgi:hypothetical protein
LRATVDLGPAEHLLDAHPQPLADRIPDVPCGATVEPIQDLIVRVMSMLTKLAAK